MNEFGRFDEPGVERGRSSASGIATVALAAAVGAGVALLFTTDTGAETRKSVSRRLRRLELRNRASKLGEAAIEGWEQVRGEGGRRMRKLRRDREDNSALYATLGTVAGAALAALLTPQGGRETREWIGSTFDDIRQNASLRWKEHRGRRTPSGPDAEASSQRPMQQANGHEAWGEDLR